MPQPPIDPALELFAIGTLLLSIVACMNVIFMRRSGPVLPYEPRRPVPWGPVGCILAAMFVLNAVIAAFAGGASDDAGIPSQAHTLSTLVSGMLLELIIVAVFLFAIAMFTKAT